MKNEYKEVKKGAEKQIFLHFFIFFSFFCIKTESNPNPTLCVLDTIPMRA